MALAGLLVCAVMLFGAPRSARAAGCPGAGLRPTAANAHAVDAATLCLVDEIRAGYRVRALRANAELGRVAFSQVASMVRFDYFADIRPTGQTPMSLTLGTRYPAHAAGISVGQNIAWGTGSYATPAHIVAEWMASRPHREIMLDGEFRDAAVAVTPALPSVLHVGRHGAVYAIEFGRRR
jgi:uncharacterized protein YkwD